jgi:hypothetical protein
MERAACQGNQMKELDVPWFGRWHCADTEYRFAKHMPGLKKYFKYKNPPQR